MFEDMTKLKKPDGTDFALNFIAGLPPAGEGTSIFILKDGSIHSGELMWTDNSLSATGKRRVLRTTNPADGLHEVFDIPASHILGYAYAGPRRGLFE